MLNCKVYCKSVQNYLLKFIIYYIVVIQKFIQEASFNLTSLLLIKLVSLLWKFILIM